MTRQTGEHDLTERRRRGLELQTRLPKPRYKVPSHWVRPSERDDVEAPAALGCTAAGSGTVGLLVAALSAMVLVQRWRRRKSAPR